MTATIDGQAFASDAQSATATVSASTPGFYTLMGARTISQTNNLTVSVTLYNIAGTGTYPLGVTAVVFGGTASVLQASGSTFGSWLTPLSGASGRVTLSTLTSTRIAGTFDFVAAGSLDPTSTRTVTNGSFDLPVTGTSGTLPGNKGSSITARINGAPWTAAAIVASYSSSVLAFTGGTLVGNTPYSLSFIIGSMTGPGTYALSTTASRTLAVTSGSQGWDSRLAGTGAVIVTELTTARVKGSFTATLPPIGGGGTLIIDSGTFNVGLP